MKVPSSSELQAVLVKKGFPVRGEHIDINDVTRPIGIIAVEELSPILHALADTARDNSDTEDLYPLFIDTMYRLARTENLYSVFSRVVSEIAKIDTLSHPNLIGIRSRVFNSDAYDDLLIFCDNNLQVLDAFTVNLDQNFSLSLGHDKTLTLAPGIYENAFNYNNGTLSQFSMLPLSEISVNNNNNYVYTEVMSGIYGISIGRSCKGQSYSQKLEGMFAVELQSVTDWARLEHLLQTKTTVQGNANRLVNFIILEEKDFSE